MYAIFTILHTNDMYAASPLARGPRWWRRPAAQPGTPVLYMDAGDSEDTSVRLSNLTKGTAMHHLLSAAGCDAAAVGNAAPLRYGAEVLAEHAAAARYPLLLANLRNPDGSPVPGVQLSTIREVAGLRLGLLGITAGIDGSYEQWYGLKMPEPAPLVRELAAALRQDGADIVVLLSHMGLPDDRELAAALQGSVDIIIGAHTHDLPPGGGYRQRAGGRRAIRAAPRADRRGWKMQLDAGGAACAGRYARAGAGLWALDDEVARS